MTSALPAELLINAWRGVAASGQLAPKANRWGSTEDLPHSQAALALGKPADPKNWADEDVGYGVLLIDSDAPDVDKAAGTDAPEAIQDLLAARPGTVMLRWNPTLGGRFVNRYFPDGTFQSPTIGLSPFGVGKGSLPRYVLIVGGPDVIPWSVQYAFETRHAVGRLPLSDEGLGHYVDAMLAGWPNSSIDLRAPLMWTVSIPGDITAQMRAVIANPLDKKFADEPELPRYEHITDQNATADLLLAALTARRPGLVVTSSHGLTEGSADALQDSLGLPVDVSHGHPTLEALDQAMPGGAIWYAQACCSAGGDGVSRYEQLLAPGTIALAAVTQVAALGATVAPAVTRLLERSDPVRAVLGHVEPTFDWTLRVDATGQGLGAHLVDALSTNLLADQQPLGLALADYRAGVGELHTQWATLRDDLRKGNTDVRDQLTRLRLSAIDRQSLVLLGDPTVTLPPLAGAP